MLAGTFVKHSALVQLNILCNFLNRSEHGVNSFAGMISGMERVVLITSLIGCIIAWHSVSADITFNPRDTESRVNDSTYFNCSTDILSKQIHWSHDGKYVYAGGVFYEPYLRRFQIEINNSTGAYDLIIPSVESQDVGEYSCQDDGGHGKISSAKLIVLDDEPACHTVPIQDGNGCGITPNKVLLSCSVIFHGSVPPILEWRNAGGNSLIPDVTSVVSGNRTICTATLKTDLSMNNQSYLCQTTRSVTSQYHCNSETISLEYVFSSNARVNATIDEEVTCSANSSQSCSYKWKCFNGSGSVTVSTEQVLKPTRVGSHRCEATCLMGNTSCTVDAMFVEVYSTPASEATAGQYSILLSILVVVVILLVIVVIAVLYLRRRRARERFSASKGVETIKTEQSSTPLMAVIDEDYKQVKEIDAEPNKETFGAIETGQPKSPLTALKDEDKEEVRKNHTEPKEDSKGLSVFQGKPAFVGDISRREEDKGNSIAGVTALKDVIFVASENSPVLEVYEAANKYALIGTAIVPDMVNPFDLASCLVIECVFISDSKHDSKPKEIIRIQSSLQVDKRWSTGDDFGNLSVSSEFNIILSVFGKNKLIEYTKDGETIREIVLPGSIHPNHAVKLINGQFLISHGRKNNVLHQVCIVKMNGEGLKLVNSFGGEKGTSLQQINEPNYLIVDEEGSVLVLDIGNKRVLLLDSNLQPKGEYLTQETMLRQRPYKMCLCKATCNVFVVVRSVNKGDTVLVFSIR